MCDSREFAKMLFTLLDEIERENFWIFILKVSNITFNKTRKQVYLD